jgi:hypothetical protein
VGIHRTVQKQVLPVRGSPQAEPAHRSDPDVSSGRCPTGSHPRIHYWMSLLNLLFSYQESSRYFASSSSLFTSATWKVPISRVHSGETKLPEVSQDWRTLYYTSVISSLISHIPLSSVVRCHITKGKWNGPPQHITEASHNPGHKLEVRGELLFLIIASLPYRLVSQWSSLKTRGFKLVLHRTLGETSSRSAARVGGQNPRRLSVTLLDSLL